MKSVKWIGLFSALILFLNLVLSVLFSMPTTIKGDSVIEFGNPDATNERVIELVGDGSPYMDTTTYFKMPINKGQVQSASMKISPIDENGNIPTDAYVDFGLDGEADWEFSGTGYGEMGYQTEFENGKDKNKLFLVDKKYSKEVSIKLPKSAHVTKAVMNITSRYCSGSILIVQDNADATGIGIVKTGLESLGYSTYLATSEGMLPANWDDPDTYPSIFWFVDESGTSYNGVGNAYTGKMVTYVQNGGNVLATGPNIDYTGSYSGADEVPFYTWVLHHYWGNQWGGGGSGSWNYANTQITNTTHQIFSYPNDLVSKSPWQSSLYEICWYTPSGNYANGVEVAKNVGRNRENIIVWDGYEYGDYGRTITVRTSITQGWQSTDKGDIVTPFTQNIAYWTAGFPSALEDCALDIGDTGGTPDWSHPGIFQGTETTDDFSTKLDQYLQSAPYYEDGYGNQIVEVPLNFSSGTNGGLIVSDLEIEYDFTATVNKKPDNKNLAMAINDIIPESHEVNQSQDEFTVYIGVFANSPCKFRLSDLRIIYNGAPQCSGIPNNYSVPEDYYNEYLINLTNYFTDDFQTSEFLDYEVVSFTNPAYVDVDIYDRYFLGVIAEREPNTNWYGETEIVVSAMDSDYISTNSNKFTVTIAEVNDPPEVGFTIPNINITKSATNLDIDLDAKIKVGVTEGYYFTDIDSETLYYKAIVAPSEQSNLAVQVEAGNILNITAIGEYRLHIPVRIFCDDDQWTVTKLTDYNSDVLNQEIIMNITSPSGSTPPVWKVLPDAKIPEGTIVEDWLNLRDYVTDLDDSLDNLTFSIVTISNSAFVTVNINPDASLDLLPHSEFEGISDVTLKVEDDEHNSATATFKIYMEAVNDLPLVDILKPLERETVSGTVTLEGSAYDIEDTLVSVELKFGNESSEWLKAEGLKYWKYEWDTMAFAPSSPKLVKIYARAYDGMNYSDVDTLELIVNNVNIDADGDGISNNEDVFPNDPSDWADSDGDGYGDNSDAFPNNETEWQDSDGDGHGDNSDEFPHDATEWRDTDGDGYGDNSDAYPNDRDKYLHPGSTDDDGGDDEVDITGYLWFFIAIFVIINILILIFYISVRRKEKNLKNKSP